MPTPAVGPNTKGQDHNFYKKVSVSSASFQTNADAVLIYPYTMYSIINEGPGVIEFSFNGNTLHGDMTVGTPSSAINVYESSSNKVWFRLKSGATTTVRIQSNCLATATSTSGSSGASSIVVGPTAAGAAVSTNPVLVAGWDGTNTQILRTDSSGRNLVRVVDAASSSIYSTSAALADAFANPTVGSSGAELLSFNGTTWDRVRSGQVGTLTATTGLLNSLSTGRYNAVRPYLADTNLTEFQLTPRGELAVAEQYTPSAEDNSNAILWVHNSPLAVSTKALSWSDTVAAATNVVVKAAAGRLYYMWGANLSGGLLYVQIANTASLAADGSVPVITIPVAGGATFSLSLGEHGRYFSTGITAYVSTTVGTKTLAAASLICNVGYL